MTDTVFGRSEVAGNDISRFVADHFPSTELDLSVRRGS